MSGMVGKKDELTTPDRHRLPGALASGPFRSLLLAQGVFDIGIAMRMAAQSWVILALTGSPLWVGLAAGARAMPVILFAALSGVLADRFSRRLILFLSMTWMAGLVAATALITVTGKAEAWHYVALAFGVGIGASFHGPSFYAIVTSIIPARQRARANGMVSFVGTSGEMTGPLIAGLVIAASGASTVFWIVSIGYISGALLILRVKEPARTSPIGHAPMTEFHEGLSYAAHTQPLPWLVVLVMLQNLFAVAIFPLMPVYADQVLDAGARGFGLMGGALGAGLLGSSVIVTVFGTHRRRALVMFFAGMLWDISMISFAFSRSFPLSLFLLFTMGLGGVVWVNAALSIFQNVSSEEMRGRVMSLYVLSMEMFPLGWLVGGLLAAWLGNEEALVISAICGTPVMALALLLSPSLRRA
jgi:MFS family permease